MEDSNLALVSLTRSPGPTLTNKRNRTSLILHLPVFYNSKVLIPHGSIWEAHTQHGLFALGYMHNNT